MVHNGQLNPKEVVDCTTEPLIAVSRRLLALVLSLLTPAGFGQLIPSRTDDFWVARTSVPGRNLPAYFQASAVPSSFLGCILRADGAYVLYDETTRVTVGLRGNDDVFEREWGNQVQIVGANDNAAQPDVAPQVVRVTSITRLRVGGCRAIATAIGAQLPVGQPAQQSVRALNIVILEGEGLVNNTRQRSARALIVQVRDENSQPVAGATVVFLLPERGPGGTFAGGAESLSVVTGSDGRAEASGFRPNTVAGQYQIQVEASYQELSAQATVTQTNIATAAAGGSSRKLIAILAAVGGAAAVGVVLANRSGNGEISGPPGPLPTTIIPGATVVGGPP